MNYTMYYPVLVHIKKYLTSRLNKSISETTIWFGNYSQSWEFLYTLIQYLLQYKFIIYNV